MQRTRITWKRSLALPGVLGVLVAAAALTHVSGPSCGERVLERWSIPYLIAVALIGVASVMLLSVAALVNEGAAHRIGQRLLVVGFSLGVTLGALDVAMRLTDPPRVLQPPFYQNHDRLGYFFVPKTRHRISIPAHAFSDVFVTDKNGFIVRGESNTPRPDATRIMFLGDSFMAALQVAPEDNMSVKTAARLEELTGDEYQALNLGVNGYSPLPYLLTYETFAPELDPDIVVVTVFVGNDFKDSVGLVLGDRVIYDDQGQPIAIRPAIDYEKNQVWSDPFAGPVPLEEARLRIVSERDWHRGLTGVARALIVAPICQQLHFGQNPDEGANPDDNLPVPCGDALGDEAPGCSTEKYALRNETPVREGINAIYKDAYTEQDLADIELSLSALRRLAREVAADGRDLLLVVMPENHQVPGQGEAIKYRRGLKPGEVITSTAPQDLLADFCEEEGIDCIDLLPVFKAHSDEFIYWADDSRLTPAGHELVAETIDEYLLNSR